MKMGYSPLGTRCMETISNKIDNAGLFLSTNDSQISLMRHRPSMGGVRDSASMLLNIYLTNRDQNVTKGCRLDVSPVDPRVPQGSV